MRARTRRLRRGLGNSVDGWSDRNDRWIFRIFYHMQGWDFAMLNLMSRHCVLMDSSLYCLIRCTLFFCSNYESLTSGVRRVNFGSELTW